MRTILVTGGCGAIGSEVINYMKKRFPEDLFVNLDALTYAGKKEHIEPPFDNYVFYHGNICDANIVNEILLKHKPKYVIHFAAETHVDNSFGNSLNFTTTNVYGTHVMLECVKNYMKTHEFEMFVHISTDEVYGSVNDDEKAKVETSFFAPSNPYAATKAGAEMICKSYEKSFRVPIIIVRCNNAVSKYQHEEKLIPRVIKNLLNEDKIPIHGKGESKRTFIHVFDIASALSLVISKGVVGQTYNIGTTMEYSVIEVIKIIMSEMGIREFDKHIEYVPDRMFQDYRYDINSEAIRLLGWKESISFHAAIRDVIKKHAF